MMSKKEENKKILQKERVTRAYQFFKIKCLLDFSTKQAAKHLGMGRYKMQDSIGVIKENRAIFLQRLANQIISRGAKVMIQEVGKKEEQDENIDEPLIKKDFDFLKLSQSNQSSQERISQIRPNINNQQRWEKILQQASSQNCEKNTMSQITSIIERSCQMINNEKVEIKELIKDCYKEERARNVFKEQQELFQEHKRNVTFYKNKATFASSYSQEEDQQSRSEYLINQVDFFKEWCFVPRLISEVQEEQEQEPGHRNITQKYEVQDRQE